MVMMVELVKQILELQSAERLVAVTDVTRHKANQLRDVTSRALGTTHKGDTIATFHQMALPGKVRESCLYPIGNQISMKKFVLSLVVASYSK
jgi:hypothetical protein